MKIDKGFMFWLEVQTNLPFTFIYFLFSCFFAVGYIFVELSETN